MLELGADLESAVALHRAPSRSIRSFTSVTTYPAAHRSNASPPRAGHGRFGPVVEHMKCQVIAAVSACHHRCEQSNCRLPDCKADRHALLGPVTDHVPQKVRKVSVNDRGAGAAYSDHSSRWSNGCVTTSSSFSNGARSPSVAARRAASS